MSLLATSLNPNAPHQAFQRRRSVELKHGRIAMLATMGIST